MLLKPSCETLYYFLKIKTDCLKGIVLLRLIYLLNIWISLKGRPFSPTLCTPV